MMLWLTGRRAVVCAAWRPPLVPAPPDTVALPDSLLADALAGSPRVVGPGADRDAELAPLPLLQEASSRQPVIRTALLTMPRRRRAGVFMHLGRTGVRAGSGAGDNRCREHSQNWPLHDQPGPGRPGGGAVVNPGSRRRVAVVGGGVAGLAATFLLKGAGLAVTLLEGSPRLGGKLEVSEAAG